MLGNKILEKKKSKINGEIVVKKTLGLGTYIQVGGITQSGKIIESIWKPVLKKIHRSQFIVHSSLVLGLGGGSVAKVIRKYFPKAKITGVEIDPVMVELGERYLGLGDSNVEVIIQDAKTYHLSPITYDLILVDTYLGKKYIDIAGSHLARSKIVVFNQLNPNKNFEKKLKRTFSSVEVIKPLVNTVFICKK